MRNLISINEAGREMVPLVCPLKFVQGFRCSQCPWGRLLPECHTAWAVPFCYMRKLAQEFDAHQCRDNDPLLPVLQ